MLRRLTIIVVFCGLVSVAVALAVPHLSNVTPAGASVASPIECDSSSDPCVRVYKTREEVEKQTYKVVSFSEAEIMQALEKADRRIHDKIKSETGFDCKKGRYESGFFRCEEGGLATQHQRLIQVLEMLYG